MVYRCIKTDKDFEYQQGQIYNISLHDNIYSMFHQNYYSIKELNNIIPEKYLKKDFRTIKEDRKAKLKSL